MLQKTPLALRSHSSTLEQCGEIHNDPESKEAKYNSKNIQ